MALGALPADGTGTTAAGTRVRTAHAARGSAPWVLGSVGALVGALVLGVLVGPAGLPARQVALEFLSHLPLLHVHSNLSVAEKALLWQIRVPRVVLGALVGWMLAAGGAAYQGVFRNPLADPYLLGVAAGAGMGATLAIVYGPHTSGWPVDPLPVFAFVGAIASVALTYAVGRTADRGRTAVTLVLAGVAVASFLTAVQTFLQERHTDVLRQVYSWILGQLTTSGWHAVLLVLPYVVVSSGVLLAHRRLLDVLRVGEDEAATLGVSTRRVRLVVVAAATLGTAAVVSVSGLIAFVGIIIPHTVRLLAGSSYRRVLPLSMILGAAFLVVVDVIARTVSAPGEIPIGVVTAFFGAPFFILVLRTRRQTT
jgi:iron complex transport system permease protein